MLSSCSSVLRTALLEVLYVLSSVRCEFVTMRPQSIKHVCTYFDQNDCQEIILKEFLSWRGISWPDKTFFITRIVFNHSECFFCLLGKFGGRSQYIKVFWFFKSCRSRRELSDELFESFWEAVLVEIWQF